MAYERDRGSARQRGYGVEWERETKVYKREHPLCVGCLAVDRVEPATVVDHIEPHRNDQVKFWDQTNWQGCCVWHHNQVKKLLEHRWERGEVDLTALRLDSPEAIEITKRLDTVLTIDGWLT